MSLAVNKRKIVVAITGASGAVYALSLMKRLRELPEQPSDWDLGRKLSGNNYT